AVRGEGVGERDARGDLLADLREDLAETDVLLPLEHDVEGLHDRQSRAHQRQQLLIEEEEVIGGDDLAEARHEVARAHRAALRLEHVHAHAPHLFLRGAQGVGADVTLDHFAFRGSDSYDEFRHFVRSASVRTHEREKRSARNPGQERSWNTTRATSIPLVLWQDVSRSPNQSEVYVCSAAGFFFSRCWPRCPCWRIHPTR